MAEPDLPTTVAVAWITFTITFFIFIPTTLYYGYEYSHILSSELVRKRFPHIVIFTALFGIVSTSLRPTYLQFAFIYISVNDQTLGTIHSILYPPISHGFMYLVVWRFWLLYYKFQYLHATQQASWMQHINTTVKFYIHQESV